MIESLIFAVDLLQPLCVHLCAQAHTGSLPAHTQGHLLALAGLGISSGWMAPAGLGIFSSSLISEMGKWSGREM